MQRHHLAPRSVGRGVCGRDAVAGGEQPVEGGRRAAALHVTEDGDPGLDAGPTLDLLGQALGDPAEPTVTEAVHLVLGLQHGPRDRDRTLGDHDDRRVRHAGVTALQIKDLKPGEGPAIAAGQTAEVNYTGWLYDTAAPDNKGKKFDSSVDAGRTFSFVLGAGQVISGWDQGVAGMKVGGQRRLVIPADLGYGASGAGDDIPPGATLVFDVDLVSIK